MAITFFAFGIGVLVFLAYGVYQQFSPSSAGESDSFAVLLGAAMGYIQQDDIISLDDSLLLLVIQLGRFLPILGLIVIGWIGSRLIVNATRLSQRQVIQETLSELGPLQSILAGIPARKPIAAAVEQGLRHTRRSFIVRTWSGALLFLVGVVLFTWLAIDGIRYGFTDAVRTATIGGAGIVSFIFSIIGNSQKEARAALKETTELEMMIARHAQRAEILDLFVARISEDDRHSTRPEELQEILAALLKAADHSEIATPSSQKAPAASPKSESRPAPKPKSGADPLPASESESNRDASGASSGQ